MQKRVLQYGDYLLISSDPKQSTQYLSARSSSELDVKYTSGSLTKKFDLNDLPLQMYPNIHEMIFKVNPKQNYEAQSELKTISSENSRYTLQKRRAEAEITKNQQVIDSRNGSPVLYGDQVEFLHIFTGLLLSVSRDKVDDKEFFFLKLIDTGSDSVHFSINQRGALKQEGQKVVYNDLFTLSNEHEEMLIIFPFRERSRLKTFAGSLSDDELDNLTEPISKEQLPNCKNMPLVEVGNLYDQRNAIALNISLKAQRRMKLNPQPISYTDLIRVIPIDYSPQKERKELRYGDFILLKSHSQKLTKDITLCADSSYGGVDAQVLARVSTFQDEDEGLFPVEGLFQIIPLSMNNWGHSLDYGTESEMGFSIRHFLSGRMLITSKPSDTDAEAGPSRLQLSETFYEYFKNREFNNDPEQEAIEFLKKNQLILLREISFDEDSTLDINNYFQMKSNNKYLQVQLDNISVSNNELNKKCPFFLQNFYNNMATEKEVFYMKQKFGTQNNSDTFFIDYFRIKDVARLVDYSVLALPLVSVSQYDKVVPEMIASAEQHVNKIIRKIKIDSSQHSQTSLSTLDELSQSMLRYSQILDLCMRFIYLYNLKDFGKYVEGNTRSKLSSVANLKQTYELFVGKVIKLVIISCRENPTNAFYMLQWEPLFTGMILGTVRKNQYLMKCEVDVDRILEIILQEVDHTGKYKVQIYENVCSKMLENFEFSNYDIKSLSLLVSLFKSPKNGVRELEVREFIRSRLLTDDNMKKLFRPFRKSGGSVFIELKKGEKESIQDLCGVQIRQSLKMNYISQTIRLAKELCLGFPFGFTKLYDRYFIPKDECLMMIVDDSLQDEFKSIIIKYFMECYLATECASLSINKFPNLIKLGASKKQKKSKLEKSKIEKYDKIFKYIELPQSYLPFEVTILHHKKGQGYSLKSYILTYLSNPMNCILLKPKSLDSLLQILIFMIKRGLVSNEEILVYQTIIFHFIQNMVSKYTSNNSQGNSIKDIKKTFQFAIAANAQAKQEERLQGRKGGFAGKVSSSIGGSGKSKAMRSQQQNNQLITFKEQKFLYKMLNFLKITLENRMEIKFNSIATKPDITQIFSLDKISKNVNEQTLKANLVDLMIERNKLLIDETKRIPVPSCHLTFLLFDLLQRSNLNMAERSLELLMMQYHYRSKIFTILPRIQIATSCPIFNPLYLHFSTENAVIQQKQAYIQTFDNPETNATQLVEAFEVIDDSLKKILNDLVIDRTVKDLQPLLIEKLKTINFMLPALPTKVKEEKWCWNLFNIVVFNLEYLDLKQSLLVNTFLIETIFDQLLICRQNYLEFADRSIPKTPYFPLKELIEGEASQKRNSYLRNQIVLRCLLILIYSCVKNSKIQTIVKDLIVQNMEKLFEFFYLQENKNTILKFFLLLLKTIFVENLSLIVKLNDEDQDLYNGLVDQFGANFKKGGPSMIYTLESLIMLSKYKQTALEQNQIYLVNRLLYENAEKETSTITYFLNVDFPQDITKLQYKEQHPHEIITEGNKLIDIKIVVLPCKLEMITNFIGFFAVMKDSILDKCRDKVRAYLRLPTIIKILSTFNNWFELRKNLYIFMNKVYLNEDMNSKMSKKISEFVKDIVIPELIYLSNIRKQYKSKNEGVVFLKNAMHMPSGTFSKHYLQSDTCIDAQSSLHLIYSLVSEGIKPFIERYQETISVSSIDFQIMALDRLNNDLSKAEKKIIPIMKKAILEIVNQKKKNNLTKSSGIEDSSTVELIDEIVEDPVQEYKRLRMEIEINLKKIRKWFVSKISPSKTEDFTKISLLKNILYYNFWVVEDTNKNPINGEKGKFYTRISLNGEMEYQDFYDECSSIENEDMGILSLRLLGLEKHKSTSFRRENGPFIRVINTILRILRISLNNSAKINVLVLLKALVTNSDKLEKDIRSTLLKTDIITVLFDQIISTASKQETCAQVIEFTALLLRGGDRRMQQACFDYVQKDKDNKFMEAMELFLKKTSSLFTQAEALRVMIERESDEAIVKIGELRQEDEDLITLRKETKTFIRHVILGLEFLQLLCEDHFTQMQNYLREQKTGDIIRINSINLIKVLAEVLSQYKQNIDDENMILGNQIFALLIEMVQGPCQENQEEICRTRLLESVEDLLDTLVKMSLDVAKEEIKTELILSISTFFISLLEANKKKLVITKVGIHVSIPLYLSRLKMIYSLFYKQDSNFGIMNLNQGNQEEYPLIYETEISNAEGKVLQKRQFNPLVVEGINLVILLKTISDSDLIFEKSLEKTLANTVREIIEEERNNKSSNILGMGIGNLNIGQMGGGLGQRQKSMAQFYEFFEDKVASIEIVNKDRELQKIYFPKNYVTQFLQAPSQDRFMEEVSRNSANNKISGLLENFVHFYDEMKHFEFLKFRQVQFNSNHFTFLKMTSYSFVLFINLTLVVYNLGPDPKFRIENLISRVIFVIAIIVFALQVTLSGMWFILNFPLDLQKTFILHGKSYEKIKDSRISPKKIVKLLLFLYKFGISMLMNSYLLEIIVSTVCVLWGLLYSKIFFSVMLLDIVRSSSVLKNVIKAATLNLDQFLMTGLLGVVFVFIFSSMTFFSSLKDTMVFLEVDNFQMCTDYLHCFLTILNFGMRAGGGIGETLLYPDFESETFLYMFRFVVDLIFFLMISTIYLDILFGIIVDTFKQLREEKEIKGKKTIILNSFPLINASNITRRGYEFKMLHLQYCED